MHLSRYRFTSAPECGSIKWVNMSAERVQFGRPSDGTARYVRHYVQREVRLGDISVAIPVLARSSSLVDFEFGDPLEIHSSSTGFSKQAEAAALVGLETYRQNHLMVKGNVEHFAIHFQPLALRHLFGLPVFDLTNCNHAADSVLGSAWSELKQRLGEARSFQERVQLADGFIAVQNSRASARDSIELAANEILRSHGRCRIDALAHHTGFSMRNFQRIFRESVGFSPKLFCRIVRFEAALRSKNAFPHISWTTVAQECGYHDQMHLIHEFRQFSGGTPTELLGETNPIFLPKDGCGPL